jgi:hypothetical protein
LLKTAVVSPLTQFVLVPCTASATFCPWVTTDGVTDEIEGFDCGALRARGLGTGFLARAPDVDSTTPGLGDGPIAATLLTTNINTSSKHSEVLTAQGIARANRRSLRFPRLNDHELR